MGVKVKRNLFGEYCLVNEKGVKLSPKTKIEIVEKGKYFLLSNISNNEKFDFLYNEKGELLIEQEDIPFKYEIRILNDELYSVRNNDIISIYNDEICLLQYYIQGHLNPINFISFSELITVLDCISVLHVINKKGKEILKIFGEEAKYLEKISISKDNKFLLTEYIKNSKKIFSIYSFDSNFKSKKLIEKIETRKDIELRDNKVFLVYDYDDENSVFISKVFNLDGKEILSGKYEYVKFIDLKGEDYIRVAKTSGKEGLYDLDGNCVFEEKYEYIFVENDKLVTK